jgi:predicted O-methyltransferase YrrM
MNSKVLQALKDIEKAEEVFEANEADIKYNAEPLKTKYASIPRKTGKLLYTLALAKRPSTILELGSSVGYSTIWLAAAAKESAGNVFAIEKSRNRVALAKKHFESAGLDNIEIFHGTILDVLPSFKQKVDMVFIDADKKEYEKYLDAIKPLLNPNSIVIFDNVLSHYDTVKSLILRTKKDKEFISELLPFDNGLLILTKKNTHSG